MYGMVEFLILCYSLSGELRMCVYADKAGRKGVALIRDINGKTTAFRVVVDTGEDKVGKHRRNQPGAVFIYDKPGTKLGYLSSGVLPGGRGGISMLLQGKERDSILAHPFVDTEYVLVILGVVGRSSLAAGGRGSSLPECRPISWGARQGVVRNRTQLTRESVSRYVGGGESSSYRFRGVLGKVRLGTVMVVPFGGGVRAIRVRLRV